MPRTGFYAGCFDPPTRGHVDIVTRALCLLDRVVVGVGRNADKRAWLDLPTRLALLQACLPAGVEVAAFDGLAVDAARRAGATVLVRGLRSQEDAGVEVHMCRANRALDGALETVLVVGDAATAHVSSRLVREVHRAGASLRAFVPPVVEAHLASMPPWGS